MESVRSQFQMTHPVCVQSTAASGASWSRGCPRILQEFLEHGVGLCTIQREPLNHFNGGLDRGPPDIPFRNQLPLCLEPIHVSGLHPFWDSCGVWQHANAPVDARMHNEPELPHELLRCLAWKSREYMGLTLEPFCGIVGFPSVPARPDHIFHRGCIHSLDSVSGIFPCPVIDAR